MGTYYRGTQRQTRALDAYLKLKRAAASTCGGLHSKLYREDSLTESQFSVLDALLHLGPLSPGQLSARLFKSSSNLTTVLANLENSGLVRRVRDPRDGRAHVVSLTPRGRRLIQRLLPAHMKRVVEAMNVLSVTEQQQLGRICRKLGRAHSAEGRSVRKD